MRKLYLIIIVLALATPVYAANDARFDWSLGQPTTVENSTAATTNCATRYDWSLGQPTVVYNSTVSCPVAPTPSVGGTKDDLWLLE